MTKNLNISVLVAARDEYIDQLKCILVPLLVQGFNSIYQDSLKLSEGKRVIWKFQELLKQIPQWNQTILQEESKRIKRKCPYIMDIVTAIFVTNVKILASVRLKGSRNDIRVKIPTSDIFIHSIYIESAQQIFYDPFLFHHRTKHVQENKHHVRQIIDSAVDETVRQMLPFDDILQKYLADALNDNAEFGEGESESESEEPSDSDEESINLPSDESDYDEPETDNNKVKTFDFNNGKSKFIPESDDDNEEDIDDNNNDDDDDDEEEQIKPPQPFGISHLSQQQLPSTVQQQPIQQPMQQQPMQQQPMQQQPIQQQPMQQQQINNPSVVQNGGTGGSGGNYSFF